MATRDVKKLDEMELRRMVVDIPKEVYLEVRAMALFRHENMRQYVIRALAEQLNKDKQYQ